MDEASKKTAIAKYLAGQGVLEPSQVEKKIQELAETLPAATAAEKGLTSVIDKAYESYLILTGSNTNTNGGNKPMSTAPTMPVAAATDQELVAIEKKLISEQANRDAISRNTVIEKIITDNPDPAEIIPAGTKGKVSKEAFDKLAEKFANGTYAFADDQSQANFNTLKSAADSNTDVDVYIGKGSKKALGYVVRKGTPTGAGSESVQMDKEGFTQFLTLETSGYILSTPSSSGAKLNIYAARASKKDPGKIIPERYVAVDVNKEAAKYECSKEVKNETKEATVKSALSFKYTSDRKKGNGELLVYTGRASVKANIKTATRKAAFVDVFGTGLKESNKNLLTPPTGKALEKIQTAQSAAIANLVSKANSGNSKEMRSVQNNLGLIESFMAKGSESSVTF